MTENLAGTVVTLLPKDKRTKQLIDEFGPRWRVVRDEPMIGFKGARGLLIESGPPLHGLPEEKDQRYTRWVFPAGVKP